MKERFNIISYRIFGKYIESNAGDYLDFQNKLVKARINMPFEHYISSAYLISILVSIPGGILLYLLFFSNIGLEGIFPLPIIFFLSFLFGFLAFKLLLGYPESAANLRGQKINIILPHAVALMHALSRGSNDIIGFFEIISNNKKIYGEVSEEVKTILIESKLLKKDIKTALKISAFSTPSETFKNFLESLSTVIASGSDITAFFLNMSEQFRIKAHNENKVYIETIGLFSEIYVTGFAAGPLFIIVLLVVLGLIGGTNYVLLNIIVYLFIPAGAMIFIYLLFSISKGITSGYIKNDEKPDMSGEYYAIRKGKVRMNIYYFLKDPLKETIEIPEKILYFSVPAAILFLIASTFGYSDVLLSGLSFRNETIVIFSVFIALIPYSVFVELHFRRIDQISGNFPELLNRLANLHESGLTISSSFKRLAASNLGILNKEIQKINLDLELRGSVSEAFRNFGNRINTLSVHRVVVLIENAIRMNGNIKDTLAIAASDATISKTMENEMKMSTKMNVYILYISFFVFLYVTWSIVTGFLPQIPDVPDTAVSDLIGEGMTFSSINKADYVKLFFHASILEGFFSGLVAGQMGEGDVRLGIKHAIFMCTIAYVLFLSVNLT